MGKRPFHTPFAGLKKRFGGKPTATSTATSTATATATATAPATASSDGDLWAEATAGVRKIDPGPGLAAPPPPAPGPREFWHPDLDAIDELRALVRGDAPFDLSDSDEFVEGWVAGLDPAVVKKLRRGEYAVQDHVDLHGLTREEAKRSVEHFLRSARGGGKRCVLVVHGRGNHSKDQVPVLKEALRSWLATARFGRHVLAFATARPQDGGAGAVYVLLRRPGR